MFVSKILDDLLGTSRKLFIPRSAREIRSNGLDTATLKHDTVKEFNAKIFHRHRNGRFISQSIKCTSTGMHQFGIAVGLNQR